MEEFFSKNKKVIFAVAGAAAGATLLIWLHQRTKETNKVDSEKQISTVPQEQKSKEDQGEYLSYSIYTPDVVEVKIPLRPGQDMSLPKELKKQLAQKVEIKYNEDNYLSFFTVSDLAKLIWCLSFPKFYVLLKQYRQKRRSVQGFDDERHYTARAELMQTLRDILTQSTLEVLAEINVSEEEYERSSRYQGYSLDNLVRDMKMYWLLYGFDLFNGKKLTIDERVEIIKAQTQLYKDEKESIRKLLEKRSDLNPSEAVELIENKIDDQIYQKYGVETEDFIKFSDSDTNDLEKAAREENSSTRNFFIDV